MPQKEGTKAKPVAGRDAILARWELLPTGNEEQALIKKMMQMLTVAPWRELVTLFDQIDEHLMAVDLKMLGWWMLSPVNVAQQLGMSYASTRAVGGTVDVEVGPRNEAGAVDLKIRMVPPDDLRVAAEQAKEYVRATTERSEPEGQAGKDKG